MVCPHCLSENPTAAGKCLGCGAPLVASVVIRLGTIVASRYEILTPLGKGGMGEVYRAHDRLLDEKVALKVLRAEAVERREMVQRFRAEVKLAWRIRHRNVCAIHNYGEDGALLYIAMELIEGTDLRHVLHDRTIELDEAYDLALQIADGLLAIHEAGVIHRDLKPANVMVDACGVVRLMDFGIAKQWGAGSGLTGTGKIIGTPEYMSPEQVRGGKLDYRSDVYSLGAVVFELFTGRPPFEADTPVGVIMKHIQEPPPLDQPRASRIPPALRPVLARAMAKAAADRHASVVEFAEDMRRARAAPPPTFEVDEGAEFIAAAPGAALQAPSAEHPRTRPASPVADARTRPPASEGAPPSARPAPVTFGVEEDVTFIAADPAAAPPPAPRRRARRPAPGAAAAGPSTTSPPAPATDSRREKPAPAATRSRSSSATGAPGSAPSPAPPAASDVPPAPRETGEGPEPSDEEGGWSLEFDALADSAEEWSEEFDESDATPAEEVEKLVADLRSADAALRWRAARELGERGRAARRAVPALVVALRDPVSFVRSAAAVALSRVRSR